jgi:hypothetical protein
LCSREGGRRSCRASSSGSCRCCFSSRGGIGRRCIGRRQGLCSRCRRYGSCSTGRLRHRGSNCPCIHCSYTARCSSCNSPDRVYTYYPADQGNTPSDSSPYSSPVGILSNDTPTHTLSTRSTSSISSSSMGRVCKSCYLCCSSSNQGSLRSR